MFLEVSFANYSSKKLTKVVSLTNDGSKNSFEMVPFETTKPKKIVEVPFFGNERLLQPK
jgi:hypothetical protein